MIKMEEHLLIVSSNLAAGGQGIKEEIQQDRLACARGSDEHEALRRVEFKEGLLFSEHANKTAFGLMGMAKEPGSKRVGIRGRLSMERRGQSVQQCPSGRWRLIIDQLLLRLGQLSVCNPSESLGFKSKLL